MKYFIVTLVCWCLVTGTMVAQNPINSKGNSFVGAKVLFIDHGNPIDLQSLDVTNGLEVSYRHHFGKYLALAAPLKFGQASVPEDLNKRSFFSADAILRVQYYDPEHILVPYLFGGAGYVFESGGENNTQIPIGLGIDLRVGNASYLSIQGEYRMSSLDNRDNMQVGLGFTYRFGDKKPDQDGDGVADDMDACPTTPGIATFNGCPDSDGDGISDLQDKCPQDAGSADFMGCPDRDGDGIADPEDNCPDEAGDAEGCPDEDGDGVADKDDVCPDVPGDLKYQGCADSDGDGTPDNQDDCPDVYGPLAGCPDADNDGIIDPDDDCPDEPGLRSLNGCPASDEDGDGVPDTEDACPTVAGSASGCPDLDGDGVMDSQDACPDVAGSILSGCPDEDGDGVSDSEDACPDEAGDAPTGCPDSDGDGVPNIEDVCPNESGTIENKGCPDLRDEDKETLAYAMRAVRFNPSKATFRQESYEVLDQIIAIMDRYPAYKLIISGHTDSVGEEDSNQVLSEDRARACFQYLLVNGVEVNRMSYKGYGETMPIANNSTQEGRRFNRRVEFELQVQ